MTLLLMADPNPRSVLAYVEDAHVLVCSVMGALCGVAVVSHSGVLAELKNLAVAQRHQGKGIAKRLIREAMALSVQIGAESIEVGTGNSSLDQLALYQKCGFRIVAVDRDFFSHYAEPIFENGIRCLDQVRLRVEL